MKLPPLIYLKHPLHQTENYLIRLPEYEQIQDSDEKIYVLEYQRDFKTDNWIRYWPSSSTVSQVKFSYHDIHASEEQDFGDCDNDEIIDIYEPVKEIQYISILF